MDKEKTRFKLELELEIGYVPMDKECRIDTAKKVLQSTESFIKDYVMMLDERAKNGRMLPDIDFKSFVVKEI